MAGGAAPGSNSRGRGGKFRKFTRGGGKHFSRDLRPLDADGNEISMWSKEAQDKLGDSDDDDDDDEDEVEDEDEDDSEDEEDEAPKAGEMSREDRKKLKAARKQEATAKAKSKVVQVGDLPSSEEDEEAMPVNPNRSKAARDMAVSNLSKGVKELDVSDAPNRKERASTEAAAAKERYRKLHEQGKTDEAKADLARLKLIREKREEEAARRQVEKEEREAQEQAKRAEIEAKEAKKREAALGPKKGKSKK